MCSPSSVSCPGHLVSQSPARLVVIVIVIVIVIVLGFMLRSSLYGRQRNHYNALFDINRYADAFVASRCFRWLTPPKRIDLSGRPGRLEA